jgi:hypothetical protein
MYQISIAKYAIQCAGLDVYVKAYKRTFARQILTSLNKLNPPEEDVINLINEMDYTVEDLGKLNVGGVLIDTIKLIIILTNK